MPNINIKDLIKYFFGYGSSITMSIFCAIVFFTKTTFALSPGNFAIMMALVMACYLIVQVFVLFSAKVSTEKDLVIDLILSGVPAFVIVVAMLQVEEKGNLWWAIAIPYIAFIVVDIINGFLMGLKVMRHADTLASSNN